MHVSRQPPATPPVVLTLDETEARMLRRIANMYLSYTPETGPLCHFAEQIKIGLEMAGITTDAYGR